MKDSQLMILCMAVAAVLFAIPPHLRDDPRLYLLLLAALVAYATYWGVVIWLDWKRFKRRMLEMEKRHGPGIYQTMRELKAARKGRK